MSLPRIKAPKHIQAQASRPAHEHQGAHSDDDMKQFEEAINSINIDMIHSDEDDGSLSASARSPDSEAEDYYRPSEIGEGYFSEIEHFIKNKDVHEIVDDIINKDFLTSMKDYHQSKEDGRPFFLHKHDLEKKLRKKMNLLRAKEEKWHELKAELASLEKQKQELEGFIDKESKELKDLFVQVKVNHWLEKKAADDQAFRLKNGQVLKSLNDLRKAMSYISEDEFRHHLNEEKNDFAAWARHALGIDEMADKLEKAGSKKEIEQLLSHPV